MTKINLTSNLNTKTGDIETQSRTLAELIDEISAKYGIVAIFPECEVLVNGRSYQVLADGLDTELKDGDHVDIMNFMTGGG